MAMFASLPQFGKLLIVIGLGLVVVGTLMWVLAKTTGLGHLPGDILVQKRNFTFYVPLTTCILLSLILSAIMYFISRK